MSIQGLILRLVLLTLVFSLLGLGLYWIFLPYLVQGSAEAHFPLSDAIIPLVVIGLTLASLVSYANYTEKLSLPRGDFGPLKSGFALLMFLSLLIWAYSALLLPDLQRSRLYAQNRPRTPPVKEEAPDTGPLKEGVKFYYQGEYELALERLQGFLTDHPGFSLARDYLGLTRSALAEQERIKNTRAGDQTAIFSRGYNFFLEGKYLLALMEFEAFLRFQPNHQQARQFLEDARQRLKEEQVGDEARLYTEGLKARLELKLKEALELYEAGELQGALTIFNEVELVDPNNPTARRYRDLTREKIARSGFLAEEIAFLPWRPHLKESLIQLGDGRLLRAAKLFSKNQTIWLEDFWLVPALDDPDGELFFARLAKSVSTNRLIWREGLRFVPGPDETRIKTPLAAGELELELQPERWEKASLFFDAGLKLSAPDLLTHASDLISDGYPAIRLWQELALVLVLPFVVFLMGSVGMATGWRFREPSSRQTPLALKLLSLPVTGLIAWLGFYSLTGLTQALVVLAEKLDFFGWSAIPVMIGFCLILNYLLLKRLLRRV